MINSIKACLALRRLRRDWISDSELRLAMFGFAGVSWDYASVRVMGQSIPPVVVGDASYWRKSDVERYVAEAFRQQPENPNS